MAAGNGFANSLMYSCSFASTSCPRNMIETAPYTPAMKTVLNV